MQICQSVCHDLWLLEITESIDFEGLGCAVSLGKSDWLVNFLVHSSVQPASTKTAGAPAA